MLSVVTYGYDETAHRARVPHAQSLRNPAIPHRRSFSQQGGDQDFRTITEIGSGKAPG
jgi:hypothetical protein